MKHRLSNSKALLILAGVFILVVGTDVGLVGLYYKYIENFLEGQPKNLHADAGVVFFGDYLDDLSLGPDSRQRASTAVNLYKEGKIKNIICVGGHEYHYWSGKPHIMRRFLIRHGIPPNRIFTDSLSFNTITNWREAQKIIKRNSFHKIIAISAPMHVYRISLMIGSDSVNYCSYQLKFNSANDYWRFYKDVHHEWLSHFLNFVLRDETRNRLVYFVRAVQNEVGKFI